MGSFSLSLPLSLSLSLFVSVSRLRNQTVAHFLFAFCSISLCSSVDSGAGWVLLGLAAMGPCVKVDWNLLKLSDAISSHVQKLHQAVFCPSRQRLDWGRCHPVFFLFFFSLIFDVCAMFGPFVASHFICDFLALKPGTVLPDVNADCFPFPM